MLRLRGAGRRAAAQPGDEIDLTGPARSERAVVSAPGSGPTSGRRGRRRVLRATVLGVLGALVLGVVCAGGLLLSYPKLRLVRDAVDLEPGLQTVDKGARGLVGLGEGVYVSFMPDGLRITRW
ncbi:MAG TPA: hypothetical protein VFL94_06620, partial [Actinomycetales bacterium]|nr:hypothetical protein [Actinomycetales bacterium]